ncbi:hypothetical protein JQ633_29255 [Bradyrhizobium tropiciagri]|uniref:hypothetical protein n=1 Tax=Bradyrhizobium tropiciagri TaxID=312253 RepID=UPI001BACE2FF|nr:hypothetical protein [Bradyrhizobium tropiciagri]MBR0874476.1 hypothetical protein [Bradyrhizobium tropiciagri]
MQDQPHGIVVLQVIEDNDGLYTATSRQLAGVCVSHRDLNKILSDVPNIMRLWFKRNKGMDIEVFQGPVTQHDHTRTIPMIPVPAEIAARALAR